MSLLIAAALLAADGWSKLKAGDEEVEVYRDSWGIPHVFAKTLRGAFWAEGYTEADDRFGQMETFRRGARGQAAELNGPGALANDRDRARRGYSDDELRSMFESGSERFRSAIDAYTQGVNAWLGEKGGNPRPRAWDVVDSLAIGIMMARRFGEAGDIEIMAARVMDALVAKLGEDSATKVLHDLMRESDPAAPTTLNDHLRAPAAAPKEKGLRSAPGMGDGAFAAWRRELDDILAAREALGLPVYFGSNAWVAGPKKSASGNPMLYGGPMMGFATPAVCNEIHLVAPGLNVAGMSFPGVPGVMIGWNDRVAWTTTSGGADLVDVYTLELNPENPDEYRYQGGWRKFEILDREIRVRGQEPERIKIYRSVHGPLVGERDLKAMRAHALRMSFWKQEHRTFEAVMDMNVARGIEDFRDAARKIVTSHNFFCVTVDGHIGFWYCGAHPIRKAGHDVRLPQDGGGTMEWEGMLPFERWPQAVDPPCGFFANWNNKPARAWEPSGFGKVFWGKKIIDVLEGEEKIGFERFGEIARLTAYHNFLADYFGPVIIEAAKGSDDDALKRAAETIAGWDHMETDGAAGPVIVERWVNGVASRLFGDLVDPLFLRSRQVQRYVVDPLLYLFEGERSPVKLGFDYAKGKNLRRIAQDSLREAVRGAEPPAWKEPSIDFKGDVGPVKSKSGRGTYQVEVEMTPQGPRAVTLSAPGQSEHPGSKHYSDQVDLFARWQYKPFVWRREEMK
jgi:penicillin amidase